MKHPDMHHARVLGFLTLTSILAIAACGSGHISTGSAGAGAGTGVGGGAGSGAVGTAGSTGNNGGGGGPVFGGQHPRILVNPDNLARLKNQLDTSPVTADFKNMVSQQMAGQNEYGFQGYFAAYLYLLTGDARYATYAVSFMDAKVAAEEQLISQNMEANVAFDSYLLIGEQIGDLALVYDWCFDHLTDAQKRRWLAYANQAVWNVWNPTKAKWGNTTYSWSGWSIDNPGNNYFSSFLEATQLLGLAAQGDDPMADQWLDQYRNAKVRDELVPTFNMDLQGGGSREGTGYGIEMRRIFKQYDFWQQTTGERIAELTPHTEASFFWIVHATVPTLDRIVTIGDQARESSGALFDDHRDYVQVLTWLFPQAPFAPMGQWYLSHSSVPQADRPYNLIGDLLYQQMGAPQAPLSGLYPAYYSKGTGDVFVRTGWSSDATFMSFIAGPYTESHAHRDQGSFTIFKNEWLAFDEGVLSSSGLRKDEASHNIPSVIAGGTPAMMDYGNDGTLVALADNAQYTYLASDTAHCYNGSGGVTQMEREMLFVKPGTFIVFDRVQAQSGSQKVWRLNAPVRPTVSGRVATIMGSKSRLALTPVLPTGVTPAVVDWHATDSDTDGGFRIDVTATGDGRVYFLNVLSVDGAVTAVSESSPTGMRGVTVTLGDGRTVTAQFAEATFGASLDVTGGSGPAIHGALSRTIADLPRYAN
jgi:hypothetical protein